MSKKRTKRYTTEWVRTDTVDSYGLTYRIMYGERTNGKTYAVKEKLIDHVAEGKQFAYIRRRHKHIVRLKMQELFSDINEKYAEKRIGNDIKYSTDCGFYYEKDDEKIVCGHAFSIEDSFDYKGVPYDKVDIILFDEFLDYDYMQDEIPKYIHLISTICRKRPNIIIYLLANTVSKYSPYLELFGIDPNKLRQGDVATVYHKNGVNAVIEHTPTMIDGEKISAVTGEKTDPYIGFDNDNTVKMIMFGDWETKNLNCHEIDGIGWSDKRRELIPAYFTGTGKVFEISLIAKQDPIGFVRSVNTQTGIVRKAIKYNFALDGMKLKTSECAVPLYTRLSPLVDKSVNGALNIFIECLRCGRVVFENALVGTEFLTVFDEIKKAG